MDNVELSPATRWGMIATGLLQGKRKANAVCNTCSLQTKLELLLN